MSQAGDADPRPGGVGWPALWPDPPWRMRGRHVTMRGTVPWELVERAVPPALLPERGELSARLRFWDLRFDGPPANGGLGAPASGRFREAIFGLPAQFRGRPTETAAFLWTDSEVYLTWGREFFGWPTLWSDVRLDGDVWARAVETGAMGSAHAPTSAGDVAIEDIVVGEELPPIAGAPPPSFVSLRRPLLAGRAPGAAEAVLTTMEVRDGGRRFAGSGRLVVDLAADHPLHGFALGDAALEVVDGVECLVGHQVEVWDLQPPGDRA